MHQMARDGVHLDVTQPTIPHDHLGDGETRVDAVAVPIDVERDAARAGVARADVLHSSEPAADLVDRSEGRSGARGEQAGWQGSRAAFATCSFASLRYEPAFVPHITSQSVFGLIWLVWLVTQPPYLATPAHPAALSRLVP